MSTKIYPFKFLDSYTKDDKDIFFGRDDEINLLYDMLKQSDTIMIYGASGTGKTSLIQCGLSKKINDYDWMPFYIRKGSNINTSLLTALQKFVPETEDSASDFLNELLDDNTSDQADDSPIVAALKAVYLNKFQPIYLIFDQFEELFILGNKQEQQEFVQTISEIQRIEHPIKLIFSIREEYLGYLYDFEKHVPELLRKKIRVEAMHREKVQQIIQGISDLPQANITIEATQIDEFTAQVFSKLKGKKELTIQLPYLQVFLDKLYLETTSDKERKADATFTLDSLQNIGNIGDILSEFIEEQVREVSNSLKSSFAQVDSKLIWKMLSPFATLEGTKDPLSKAQLTERLPGIDKNLLDQVLNSFINRRIIRYSESDDSYELAHDALAQRVSEKRSEDEIAMLQARQLIKSQSSLKADAREYFSEKQLAIIEPFQEQLDLTADEKSWIAESYRIAEQQRNAKLTRQRRIIVGVAIAAVISIAFGVFGFINWRIAQENLIKAINLQLAGKAKDAISFKEQQQFTAAIGKYKELLGLYRKYPQVKTDSLAVYEDITECRQLDSTRTVFTAYMNQADSLIEFRDLGNIKESYGYFVKAKDLNFRFAKDRTDKYTIKLEPTYKNLKDQAIALLNTGQTGKAIASDILKFLAEVDPEDKDVQQLMKKL